MSIDLDIHDNIATITINRPERMNALDHAHYKALSEAWKQVRDTDSIRAAIITGAGDRAFCAGADLKDYIPVPPSPAEMWQTQKDQLLNRGLEVWKPIIAAVNGWCVGGGMTLLLATDIRLAAPHANFGLSEVKRGIIPGNGGTQRVLSQLPYAIGMEMLLTGDPISAEIAARWGLINKIVPGAKLLASAMELAKRIAANAPLAVQAAKELAVRSRDVDLPTGLRIEQFITWLLQKTPDASEGARAFAEKRAAKFTGR